MRERKEEKGKERGERREGERERSHWKEKRFINSESLDLNFNGDLWDSKEKHCMDENKKVVLRRQRLRYLALVNVGRTHTHARTHAHTFPLSSKSLSPF